MADVNFFDPDFIADPYPTIAKLRTRAGVHFDPLLNGWWALRYADMADILRSPRFAKDPHKAADGPYTSTLLRDDPSMIFSDDPDHRRLRGLVNKAFTKRAIDRLEPRIRAITDELLDQFRPGMPVEFMEAVAQPLPIRVIAAMIGVERGDLAEFRRWSTAVGRSFDPFVSEDDGAEIGRCFDELRSFFAAVVDVRRRIPRDDLASALVAAQEADGDRLTDREIVGLLTLLLVAGNITTTDLLGNGVLAFLQHPEQWSKLCRRTDLVVNAIEEVLRYDSPVVVNDRITTADEEIAGCPVGARQWVWPIIGAANHDPERFPEPDRFDIDRNDIGHQSFGAGPHVCLGAPLARLEAKVVFETLAERFAGLRLDPSRPFVRAQVPFFRGLKELWIVPD